MRRTEVIFIRCSKNTYRKFKLFVAEKGFRNYEEALIYLLNKARESELSEPKKDVVW